MDANPPHSEAKNQQKLTSEKAWKVRGKRLTALTGVTGGSRVSSVCGKGKDTRWELTVA